MRVNKLKLNPDNTEVLLVNQKPDQGIGLQPLLDEVTFPLELQVRSLRGLLDSSQRPDSQVSEVPLHP